MKQVSDKGKRRGKTLTDKVKEAVQGALEALDRLLAPPPALVPVRVRRGPRG